ncbi:hypothetical protein VTN77DRAFT_7001 [Rasamsonia byssochlamydoides]|uniref:uncharacterized protein n=1 Tax=Rasamsonia byssochlamydoides TaxID=89139 RepID=UPI003742D724
MAPLSPRQGHPPFPPPRPPKGPPGGVPVEVTKLISLKVFLLLFLGTAGIFCFAILFWKTGSFLRRFTRGRIFRERKLSTTRYVKTWYGWIPQEEHEARKKRLRQRWRRLRKWTSWKSSHDDYRWVWWDPSLEYTQKHIDDQRILRWVPRCMRSYEYQTANSIWNPGPPADGAEMESDKKRKSYPLFDGNQEHSDTQPLAAYDREANSLVTGGLMYDGLSGTPSKYLTFPLYHRRLKRAPRAALPHSETVQHQCFPARLTFLGSGRTLGRKYQRIDDSKSRGPPPRNELRCTLSSDTRITRKYRAWSARMQVEGFKKAMFRQRGFMGRPGSPLSEFLSSVSEQGASPGQMRASIPMLRSTEESPDGNHVFSRPAGNGIPLLPPQAVTTTSAPSVPQKPRSSCPCDDPELAEPQQQKVFQISKQKRAARRTLPLGLRLTDSEIRLLFSLDRKLEWLLSECDPGRKPFHFATLPNHWLNPNTWIVYDPPSRVSNDARRRYGDPRFNVPFPDPYAEPRRRKYPVTSHKRAYTPRIDSWRIAVNRERRSAGLRDFLKTVELFDSSADEPPDGHVDPASWILPKPPQGFGMSTRQRNAYYEGGAGWQEKLDEWQKVDRLYRVRKVICEGKVNRGRVREIVCGIGRMSQAPVKKRGCSSASSLGRQHDIEKQRRQARSGSGALQ